MSGEFRLTDTTYTAYGVTLHVNTMRDSDERCTTTVRTPLEGWDHMLLVEILNSYNYGRGVRHSPNRQSFIFSEDDADNVEAWCDEIAAAVATVRNSNKRDRRDRY